MSLLCILRYKSLQPLFIFHKRLMFNRANIMFVCVLQVQGFFSSLKERGSQMRSVQEALETIRLNQRWMDKNLPSLGKWL